MSIPGNGSYSRVLSLSAPVSLLLEDQMWCAFGNKLGDSDQHQEHLVDNVIQEIRDCYQVVSVLSNLVSDSVQSLNTVFFYFLVISYLFLVSSGMIYINFVNVVAIYTFVWSIA